MIKISVFFLILIVAVYVLFAWRYGTPPVLKEKSDYAMFVSPPERTCGDLAKRSDITINDNILLEGIGRRLTLDASLPDIPVYSPVFGARNREVRLILAKMNGGGEDTENAVELALAYFARIQNSNGSWIDSGRKYGNSGLVLLCFLGAGYHHKDGKYHEVVNKGLNFMLGNTAEAGSIKGENHYTSAIAGMVFAEAYALTGDIRCKEAAGKILDYFARTQGPEGGWDYGPYREDKDKYDTSVTGWVIMAFKSARMAGIPLPENVVDRYLEYARTITREDGLSTYNMIKGVPHKKRYTPTMTASTLMCRLYMGDGLNTPLMLKGIKHLTDRLKGKYIPRWSRKKYSMDCYFWYHAAQVAFLVGGDAWTKWNRMLKDMIVRHQVKNGADKGSWGNPEYFKWMRHNKGGYVYPTAMNTMTLQTYYRYYH